MVKKVVETGLEARREAGPACFACHGDVSRWCQHCRRTGVEPAADALATALTILALYTLSAR